jgi:hypothetical protein
MSASLYLALDTVIAELKKCAEAGEWEQAALMATRISAQLGAESGTSRFPAARAEDRAALESCLANIAAIVERAAPLREDVGRLLKAFDPKTPDAASGQ